MAFLLKAGKQIIETSTKSQLLLPKAPVYFTLLKKTISSSANKTYEDLFAWVAADVHAHSRYTSLLATLCVSDPELESQLPSKTENSAESKSATNCLSKILENFSRKVLFVGDTNSVETISKTKLQITFPKMANIIAEECESEWIYKHSRFRFKSGQGLFHVFVNVSDMEEETLVVLILDDSLLVRGKPTTAPTCGKIKKEVLKDMNGQLYEITHLPQATREVVDTTRLYYKGYDLKQATGEIMDGGELRISYPVVDEEVERPRCMQVILNKSHD